MTALRRRSASGGGGGLIAGPSAARPQVPRGNTDSSSGASFVSEGSRASGAGGGSSSNPPSPAGPAVVSVTRTHSGVVTVAKAEVRDLDMDMLLLDGLQVRQSGAGCRE
jgi:hypothetical protein